jgi:hypothetical protein
MRPVIIELSDRNRQLEEQGNQYVTQITEQKKEIKRLKNDVYQQSKQTAIHQDGSRPCGIEAAPLITRVDTHQREYQQLKAELRPTDIEIRSTIIESRVRNSPCFKN